MNLAERIKKQTDKILRQQSQGPNAGVVVVVNAGSETPSISNPAGDLNRHKNSGDHDGRYARVFTDLNDVPGDYTGQAGKALLVSSEEDGLEFGEAGGGSEYELPQATASVLGGVRAKAKTTETAEVAIDEATGKLYAPAPDEAANGIPAGGTAGQVLVKIDDANYNAQWIDPPSGGNEVVGCTIYLGNRTLASVSGDRIVELDNILIDDANMADLANNAIIIPSDGWYSMYGHVRTSNTPSGWYVANIAVNDISRLRGAQIDDPTQETFVAGLTYCLAGDIIKLRFFSSGSTSVIGNDRMDYTVLTVVKIG